MTSRWQAHDAFGNGWLIEQFELDRRRPKARNADCARHPSLLFLVLKALPPQVLQSRGSPLGLVFDDDPGSHCPPTYVEGHQYDARGLLLAAKRKPQRQLPQRARWGLKLDK